MKTLSNEKKPFVPTCSGCGTVVEAGQENDDVSDGISTPDTLSTRPALH